MALLAAIEAALHGKDERLVAKCNVPGILAVFERWDIYDVATLSANLASSYADLQKDLAPVAALSFLALLKATISRVDSAPPPVTPSSAPPTTPCHEPPFFPPPLHPSPLMAIPLVVTVKMNGKEVAARTTLPVPPSATWEAVAKMRLAAVLDAAEVEGYMSAPLTVSLFPSADHLPSQRAGAAISDTVASGFTLGYPHALLAFSPPIYGCARPAARGVDAPARMMVDAAKQVRRRPPTAANPRALPIRARRPSNRLPSRLRVASARRARQAATGCSRAASAPPSTTTQKRAWVRLGWRTRPLPSQPRSRGCARHASRRASPPSSGRSSSQRGSARPAPRSHARSAHGSEQSTMAAQLGRRPWVAASVALAASRM